MITSACGTGTARWIAHHALYLKCREKAAREASPTACIIDSQSVKSAEKGGLGQPRLRCRQAGLKKRHVLVDTQGLRLHGTPPPIQDRDGGLALLATLFGLGEIGRRRQRTIGGRSFTAPWPILARVETEIVKRSDRVKGFVVQPRRWVVERTIAWLNRCRRLAKDWENLNRNALAFKKPRIRVAIRRSLFDSCENSVILHKVSGRTLSVRPGTL